MMSRFQWLAKQLSQKFWVIAVLFGLLGLSTAFVAKVIGPFLPDGLADVLGSDAVAPILTILATTMLTVVTFSVSVMVSALANAASHVTPRVTALLSTERTTQRVLSIFLGAFVYSLIGLIALQGGLYGKEAKLVLFGVTILVVLTVVAAMVRWIQHLTVFGLMIDSIQKVERSARHAILRRVHDPGLGGHLSDGPPEGSWPVMSAEVGYVRHVDLDALQDWAEARGARAHVAAMPGAFVHHGAALVHVAGGEEVHTSDVTDAFTIDDTRTFDQDPRFGLCVLAEVAQRALSPAVNDPGTAIDILTRMVRLLSLWVPSDAHEVRHDRISVPPVRVADLLGDGFPAIARDGSAIYAVQMRLQKSLLALAQTDPVTFAADAVIQSERALARAKDEMMEHEWASLTAVAREIETCAQTSRPQRS